MHYITIRLSPVKLSRVKLWRKKIHGMPTLQIMSVHGKTSQSDPHDPKAIQQHEEGRQSYGVPPRWWDLDPPEGLK